MVLLPRINIKLKEYGIVYFCYRSIKEVFKDYIENNTNLYSEKNGKAPCLRDIFQEEHLEDDILLFGYIVLDDRFDKRLSIKSILLPIEVKKKEMYKKWIWKAETRNLIKINGRRYLELFWE